MTIPEIEEEIATLQQSLTQTQERMEQLGKLLSDVKRSEEISEILKCIDYEKYSCLSQINEIEDNMSNTDLERRNQ